MSRLTTLRSTSHPLHNQQTNAPRDQKPRHEDPQGRPGEKPRSSETTFEKRSFRNKTPQTEDSITSVFGGELIDSEHSGFISVVKRHKPKRDSLIWLTIRARISEYLVFHVLCLFQNLLHSSTHVNISKCLLIKSFIW